MSWTPDFYIGGPQPWPDSVRVVLDWTDETRRYVPERTCTIESARYNEYGYAPQPNDFSYDLSCGHTVTDSEPPDYCKYCGAKVTDA